MARIGACAAVLATLAAVAVVVPATASAAQCRGGDASPKKLSVREAEKAVICLINKERKSNGVGKLKRQNNQAEAARKHTKVMVRKRCFSHQCPGESDLTGRLTKARYLPCSCSWGVGENIAYGGGSLGSPRGIVDSWMKSSGHRANILNRGFQHIGVGVAWGTPSNDRDRGSATYTTTFGYKR